MARPADHSKILQSFRFSGRSSGMVKTLRGFKKSHHSVPDAVNAATTGFLAKLAEEELAEEAEQHFQLARTLLHYKRKDLTLELSPGAATLSARDFVFEITYSLSEAAPSDYVVTRSLHSLKRSDFLFTPECDRLFEGQFSEVVFVLVKGAPVERVIDAIEELDTPDSDSELRVDYPSNYETCTISVPGVEAEVRFDGRELAMVFPSSAAPRELWESFLAVREAFGLTKDEVLAQLIANS